MSIQPNHDVDMILSDHIDSLIGATTLVLAYGLDIKLVNDPFVHLADDSMRPLIEAIVPGAFLVDLIPVLQYVPAWFPGAGFQRKAREWKKMTMTFRNTPYEAAKHAIVRVRPSIDNSADE